MKNYIVINGQLVIMLGEKLELRKKDDIHVHICTLVRLQVDGLVIRDEDNKRKTIHLDNIAEINGLACSKDSIKLHRR